MPPWLLIRFALAVIEVRAIASFGNLVYAVMTNVFPECALYTDDELKELKNWSGDASKMMERLTSYVPCFRDPHDYFMPSRRVLGGKTGYLPSIIRSLRLQYMGVKDDPERLEEWERAKRAEFVERQSWASECSNWYSDRQHAEQLAINRVRKERRETIESKLTPLGWTWREFSSPEFFRHPLVSKAKPLTDQNWDTIQHVFTKLHEEIAARQQKQARRRVYQARLVSFWDVYKERCDEIVYENDRVLMPFGTFMLSETAESINNFLYTTPIGREISKAEISPLLPKFVIENASQEWVLQKETELQAHLDKLRVRRVHTEVVFKCKYCSGVLWAPRIFLHNCFGYDRKTREDDPVEVWKWREDVPHHLVDCRRWSPGMFHYDSARTHLLEEIVALCGVSTPSELEEETLLFECLDCGKGTRRTFYRLYGALYHHFRAKNSRAHTLSLTSYDDQMRLRVQNDEYRTRVLTYLGLRAVRCKLCSAPPASGPLDLYSH
ncbi:hypothetical protein V5O48_013830, partial [Marasmius crinis-equi]